MVKQIQEDPSKLQYASENLNKSQEFWKKLFVNRDNIERILPFVDRKTITGKSIWTTILSIYPNMIKDKIDLIKSLSLPIHVWVTIFTIIEDKELIKDVPLSIYTWTQICKENRDLIPHVPSTVKEDSEFKNVMKEYIKTSRHNANILLDHYFEDVNDMFEAIKKNNEYIRQIKNDEMKARVVEFFKVQLDADKTALENEKNDSKEDYTDEERTKREYKIRKLESNIDKYKIILRMADSSASEDLKKDRDIVLEALK